MPLVGRDPHELTKQMSAVRNRPRPPVRRPPVDHGRRPSASVRSLVTAARGSSRRSWWASGLRQGFSRSLSWTPSGRIMRSGRGSTRSPERRRRLRPRCSFPAASAARSGRGGVCRRSGAATRWGSKGCGITRVRACRRGVGQRRRGAARGRGHRGAGRQVASAHHRGPGTRRGGCRRAASLVSAGRSADRGAVACGRPLPVGWTSVRRPRSPGRRPGRGRRRVRGRPFGVRP